MTFILFSLGFCGRGWRGWRTRWSYKKSFGCNSLHLRYWRVNKNFGVIIVNVALFYGFDDFLIENFVKWDIRTLSSPSVVLIDLTNFHQNVNCRNCGEEGHDEITNYFSVGCRILIGNRCILLLL